jgi:hypothetical protein
MAEPTSALKFYDLLLRVAIKAGVAYYSITGQGKPTVPVDAHNLDMCRRIINDGVRTFVASVPPTGWKWQERFANVTFYPDGDGSDNIDNDPARYTLPGDFSGQVDGPITYVANTNTGSVIEWVSESEIRRRRAVNIITGYPLRAAVRPYQSAAGELGSSRRWELIVDPAPVGADTVIIPYTSHFNEMTAETGTATDGSSTTLVDSGRLEEDDFFNTWVLTVVGGTGLGQTATITDYSDGTFTFTALSGGSSPDNTSVYFVEPASNLHPAGMAMDDAVKSACYAETEKQVEEVNEGLVELYYKVDLPNAWRLDGLSRPRRLRRHKRVPHRSWLNVTTEHDI